MDTIFTATPGQLVRPLVIAVIIVVVTLAWRAVRAPHLARIGLRNMVRRPLRTLLIVFGLMLATTFVSAALAIDDTIVLAVKNVAVFNVGRIDEEILGGSGPHGLFAQADAVPVQQTLHPDPRVSGVAPALTLDDALLVDESSRQVRGRVLGVAIDPIHAGPLADLQAVSDATQADVSTLAADELYLNRSAGTLLDAHPGDIVYIYSQQWPGHRFQFRVRNVVSGGLFGERPSFLCSLDTLQTLLAVPGGINRIYIANTGDGVSGVGYSDDITRRLKTVLPSYLRVSEVKQADVQNALQTQDVFARILTLYTLFALTIGLLLIFLIFVLLATERRIELGMSRAVGMHRSDVMWMLLFEGAAYDVAAAVPGVLVGLGLGVGIIVLVSPTIAQLGFPLRIDLEPGSLLTAFCLGLLFTLATILLAVWTVSRMTVAAALRGLPDPPAPPARLSVLLGRALRATPLLARAPLKPLGAWTAVLLAFILRGLLPLAAGALMLPWAVDQHQSLGFSVALSLSLVGVVLFIRWIVTVVVALYLRKRHPKDAARLYARFDLAADRLSALLIGGGLVLYWSLPFDVLERLGLPHFTGGIEIFFTAGVMMVFGAVLAIVPNLDLILVPVKRLSARVGSLRHVTYIALIYPSYQRFRTGVGLSLFSLVCFTMVVMACVAASTTQRYGNVAAETGGYDIVGQSLFTPAGNASDVTRAILRQSPNEAANIAAVSSATPVPLGAIQPDASNARWGVYPASAISGAFLDGKGLPLVARAPGYATDADVWRTVRDQPGYVVVDVGALSPQDAAVLGIKLPPPLNAEQFVEPPIVSNVLGLANRQALLGRTVPGAAQDALPDDAALVLNNPSILHANTLELSGIATGAGAIAPTPLWIADFRGGDLTKVTVIGLVDNAHAQAYGILGSPDTFAPVERGLQPFGNQFYYFKLRPGADAHEAARSISSALLDNGFETTVISDFLLDVNGPRIFASKVLVGLVGLTLLVGMAALAVTGLRAVVERQQQIGMLRALGFRRRQIQALFVIESLIVGGIGTGLGLLLGLILCRNVFAVDFFEQIRSGIALVVPWGALALMCGAALAVSLLAALLPAIRAGRITPADALRYE